MSRKGKGVNKAEISKLDQYLKKLFGNPAIELRARARQEDSAEVYIAGEFVGIVFRDMEDGELSWNFQMAIFPVDLEPS